MRLDWKNSDNSIVRTEIIVELKKFQSIIIFGAGESGEWAYRLLRRFELIPVCYCDNSPRKRGTVKNGLPILAFEEAIEKYRTAAICIASMWVEEIREQIKRADEKLLSRTWNLLSTMAWETSTLVFRGSECEYIRDNKKELEKLYDYFPDELSKQTLEAILNYRLTRDEKWLRQIKCNNDEYLDQEVVLSKYSEKIIQGSIIDGGAFDGDTVKEFIDVLGNESCLEIHCYEADLKNCELIRPQINGWQPHKVYLHETGLWSESGQELCFDGNGLSGKIVSKKDREERTIITESIDDYNYQNLSFIKLDIEGAERKALGGARETIIRCQPVLAICAYHLQDDLLVLSDFIRSLPCRYEMALRHYMSSAGDTILYGLPVK